MIRIRPLVLAIAAMAPALARSDVPLWGPHVDIEAKPGSKRTLGEADLFLPLSQDARTLVFGNLRARLDNQSSYEGNLGAGIRRMVDGGWNLGAYGYWDHRRSSNGNFFDQVTLGAEALGRDWDFRANGYVPVGTRAYTLGSESTAAVSGASVQVTTTTREERALKGFDAEAGWRAPIFDSEASRQLRLYVGGYRFSHAGTIVEGPRLRAELALDEPPWFGQGARLFLSAEMQDDNARGGQSFLGVRLRIPLGKEGASSRTLTAQERRMTAPVMRDVDIVTRNRVASTLVETATVTAGGQTIKVVDSATTGGAALPGEVAGAGNNSTVILSGTFNTTNAPVVLQTGQTVMGAGSLAVRSPSGRTATLTTPGATLNATTSGADGDAVTMAAGSTLSGMTINQNHAGGVINLRGVNADNVGGNITVANNVISITSASSNAFGVRFLGNSPGNVVSNNTITVVNTNGNALGLQMGGASAVNRAKATVIGNTFSADGTTGDYAIYRSDSEVLSGSTGNTILLGNCPLAAANTGSVFLTNGSTCP